MQTTSNHRTSTQRRSINRAMRAAGWTAERRTEDDNADEYMLSRAQWRALRRQAERLRATLGDGRLRLIDWLARKEWLP